MREFDRRCSGSLDKTSETLESELLRRCSATVSPLHIPIMKNLHFKDFFWNSDLTCTSGYDAIIQYLNDGKRTCKEVEDFMKARASIEEKYAKELLGLSKKVCGHNEMNSLKRSLDVFKLQMEHVSLSHLQLAQSMREEAKKLEEFREKQKEVRKKLEQQMDVLHKQRSTHFKKTMDSKKTYDQKCRDKEEADQNVNRNANTNNTKHMEKLYSKAQQAKQNAEEAAPVLYENFYNGQKSPTTAPPSRLPPPIIRKGQMSDLKVYPSVECDESLSVLNINVASKQQHGEWRYQSGVSQATRSSTSTDGCTGPGPRCRKALTSTAFRTEICCLDREDICCSLEEERDDQKPACSIIFISSYFTSWVEDMKKRIVEQAAEDGAIDQHLADLYVDRQTRQVVSQRGEDVIVGVDDKHNVWNSDTCLSDVGRQHNLKKSQSRAEQSRGD
ncbi:hypothetical protein INR49_025896 [Caranx melampygus]|nr:hypothetical protein INR49_025896 [Caranx melampygus]